MEDLPQVLVSDQKQQLHFWKVGDEGHDYLLAVPITETIPEEPEDGVTPQGIQIAGVDIHGQFLQQALQQPVIVIPPLIDNPPNLQIVDNQDLPPAGGSTQSFSTRSSNS